MEKIDVESRAARARQLFMEGYSCAQAVVLAYADLLEIDETKAAVLTAPLGGGMGRLREVCGAVSAAFMVSGWKYASADPQDKAAKTRCYTAVQDMAARFRQVNGSIVCRELLGLPAGADLPVPSDRTEGYYRRRPCPDYIAVAARIVGEKLNEALSESCEMGE